MSDLHDSSRAHFRTPWDFSYRSHSSERNSSYVRRNFRRYSRSRVVVETWTVVMVAVRFGMRPLNHSSNRTYRHMGHHRTMGCQSDASLAPFTFGRPLWTPWDAENGRLRPEGRPQWTWAALLAAFRLVPMWESSTRVCVERARRFVRASVWVVAKRSSACDPPPNACNTRIANRLREGERYRYATGRWPGVTPPVARGHRVAFASKQR